MKSSRLYVFLISFGFLFFILGGIFLIIGALVNKTPIVYTGIISILVGVSFYVSLGILLIIKFLRKKGEK